LSGFVVIQRAVGRGAAGAETQAGPLAAAWRIGSDGVRPELFDASVMFWL